MFAVAVAAAVAVVVIVVVVVVAVAAAAADCLQQRCPDSPRFQPFYSFSESILMRAMTFLRMMTYDDCRGSCYIACQGSMTDGFSDSQFTDCSRLLSLLLSLCSFIPLYLFSPACKYSLHVYCRSYVDLLASLRDCRIHCLNV